MPVVSFRQFLKLALRDGLSYAAAKRYYAFLTKKSKSVKTLHGHD